MKVNSKKVRLDFLCCASQNEGENVGTWHAMEGWVFENDRACIWHVMADELMKINHLSLILEVGLMVCLDWGRGRVSKVE